MSQIVIVNKFLIILIIFPIILWIISIIVGVGGIFGGSFIKGTLLYLLEMCGEALLQICLAYCLGP